MPRPQKLTASLRNYGSKMHHFGCMPRRGTWRDTEFKEYNFDALGLPPACGALHPLLKAWALGFEGCGMLRCRDEGSRTQHALRLFGSKLLVHAGRLTCRYLIALFACYCSASLRQQATMCGMRIGMRCLLPHLPDVLKLAVLSRACFK